MKKPYVYDKAKYHYDGEFPAGLPDEQAFVHTGIFLGWIVEHKLYSDDFAEDAEQIEAFINRKMTGAKLYEWFDGVLKDDMLNDEGNAFAMHYFNLEKGAYMRDYTQVLCQDLPSEYHVKDTWDNYDKMKRRIEQRYNEWKSGSYKKWWMFWK